jgi:spore coat protein H
VESDTADAALAQAPAARSKLPVYELKMEPKDLAALERSAFSNQTVPATFVANGETYPGVTVRYRGAWARSWPKKPLKIFFQKDKPFQGHHCLNLNSGWHDPALLRECLAYHVYKACGAPAPESRMVRVDVNGRFRGVYVQVEQPDQAFARELKLKGASIYKAASRSNQADERDLGSEEAYRRHYEKQSKKQEDYRDLQQFCHDLARSSDAVDFFNRHVDVDSYVNYLAATALTQNWDGFNKNHYLIYDGEGSKKWFIVPWDLDRTFGDHWQWSFDESELSIVLGTHTEPGVTGWNRLQDRFFSSPVLRKRLATRMKELVENEFTPAKLFPVLDQLEAEMAPDAALDRRRWPAPSGDLHSAIEQVKRFIERRRTAVSRQISRL